MDHQKGDKAWILELVVDRIQEEGVRRAILTDGSGSNYRFLGVR